MNHNSKIIPLRLTPSRTPLLLWFTSIVASALIMSNAYTLRQLLEARAVIILLNKPTWAAIYNEGSTNAVFIGRVTRSNVSNIVVSTTSKIGTMPTNSP